jgi:hypothetical protein
MSPAFYLNNRHQPRQTPVSIDSRGSAGDFAGFFVYYVELDLIVYASNSFCFILLAFNRPKVSLEMPCLPSYHCNTLLTHKPGQYKVLWEGIIMAFVEKPNLPEKAVSLVVVDDRISRRAEDRLNALGVKALKLRPHRGLYPAVSCHPDMQLHHIGGKTIIYAPGTDQTLLDALAAFDFLLIMGESVLSVSYPEDIAYNAARVGKWYFHNLRHTDPIIRRSLERMGIEPVHVEQGYSKCSVLPVGDESIITTDIGIAKAAEKKGLDVLLTDYERAIRLPGLDYGFIGGAAGMLGKELCALNGNIWGLDCFDAFSSFLSKNNIKFAELSDEQVTDIGSILPLMVR